MSEETHLFIIWENARYKQDEIIEDIGKNLKILKIYEIEWEQNEFSNNLSRFYGTNLPKGSGKEKHCGTGKFLLIIVKDTDPKYEERETSKGKKIVNVKMFDQKEKYRNWTGGGHKIHATNNEEETNHDLTLLLDKNIKDFLKENSLEKDNGNIQKIKKDLFGNKQWNKVSDMFYALNNCTNYAILRNYEALPNEIYENDHNDIDLICDSLEDVAYVLNAKPTCEETYRVQYQAQVEGRIAYFDLRHIGDNYYYEELEKNILKERTYNEKGFYTLSKENYFYTLLYHALIHKNEFKIDYKEKLMKMQIEEVEMEALKKWMIKKEYIIVVPNDKTVIFNKENAKYFKPLIYKENNESEINQLKIENKKLNEEIYNLRTTIEGITDSRIWKITKPLRKIRRKLK